MTRLLLKLPWFVSAPAIVALAAALAIGANLTLGDYFERTFLDEADPLAAIGAASSVGLDGSTDGANDEVNTPVGLASPTAHFPNGTPTPSAGGAPPVDPAPADAPVAIGDPASGGGSDSSSGAPGVLAQGEFRDGEPGHNGEGVAKIIRAADGSLVLRFEDFSVTNGPDLFVILLDNADGDYGAANERLDLGGLRATDGNINYDIPAGTDISKYRSALIWCRAFSVTFAFAPLEAT